MFTDRYLSGKIGHEIDTCNSVLLCHLMTLVLEEYFLNQQVGDQNKEKTYQRGEGGCFFSCRDPNQSNF
jgi:hypothetical protein